MNEIVIIALAGFTTGITTVLFGFGGGFVVVPFVYQLMLRQPAIAGNAMHVAVATSTAVMIFNAGWVSYRNWRAGRLAAQTLFPLLWFIAIGAVVGSCLAGILSENIVRALFILYMLATISDCLLRKGFFTGSARRRLSMLATISDCLLRKGFFTGSARRRLSLPVVTGGGVIIGTIAALLGVGGSVMTVPLLRRHGYAMQECVSASNPLSLPVALCGAVTYAVIGWHSIPLSGFMGFISLKILGLLVLTGWAGIVFSRRAIPAVPDVWYARIYVLLLCLVLLAMLIQ
ncbi:TPA: sulfite exporter TauE/SafE family protein [Klebsiella pneumoniae]